MSSLKLTLFFCVALISFSSTWSLGIFEEALHNLKDNEDVEQLQKALQDYASSPSYKPYKGAEAASQERNQGFSIEFNKTCASPWSCYDCNTVNRCFNIGLWMWSINTQCDWWIPFCNSTGILAWCQQGSDSGCTGHR